MLLGTLAKLGPGELRAAWSKADDREASNDDTTLASVGYDYPLSKRTLLYGTVIRQKETGDSADNGIELGLRHSF
jgi:predicted porin